MPNSRSLLKAHGENITTCRPTFDLPTDPHQIGPGILGERVRKIAYGRARVVRVVPHRESRQLATSKIPPLEYMLSPCHPLPANPHQIGPWILGEGVKKSACGRARVTCVARHCESGQLSTIKVLPLKNMLRRATSSRLSTDLLLLITFLPLVAISSWCLETSCGSPHYPISQIVRGERYLGTATEIRSCCAIAPPEHRRETSCRRTHCPSPEIAQGSAILILLLISGTVVQFSSGAAGSTPTDGVYF
ncbi:uncharacterized protein FOMMEDRAFT_151467 [Fomitiporia mediterranea MF3/22]|uniref:uncharacterized protein n=1 Tax=Fomitiporia mediterranea (strain MF3/22) TaxID=694068 RepID=UPI0004408BDB|nr:uncharacterized protein FOMMEDRAFT_151467 [Fomitiporia mediterranea MF3/22]EJD08587.1 hypothetical protein FOMMEDRAFT_151467 [Fomitiporia mediterranea MF3/22]